MPRGYFTVCTSELTAKNRGGGPCTLEAADVPPEKAAAEGVKQVEHDVHARVLPG